MENAFIILKIIISKKKHKIVVFVLVLSDKLKIAPSPTEKYMSLLYLKLFITNISIYNIFNDAIFAISSIFCLAPQP